MIPLGLGMMCTYPLIGSLIEWFGIRRTAVWGALLALGGVIPLVYIARYGIVASILSVSLFVRGVGMSAIGLPSITSA
jgi:hypothetical protein